MSVFTSVVVGSILTVLAYMLSNDDVTEDPEDNRMILIVVYGVSLVLLVMQWVISASSRYVICRIIPCPQKSAGSGTTFVSRSI